METPGYARHAFSSEMERLEHDLLEMGSRAEEMVGLAVTALCTVDVALAKAVCLRDDDIDQRDLEIEDRCIRLLALQHPIATELRVISTAMKMITDIERIGDLAVEIAKIAMKIEKELGRSDIIDIPRMAKVAQRMIREALEAYVKRDLDLVRSICANDDEVDDLYRSLRGQLFDSMRSDPDNVVVDSWLLLAIHHVERIADHAVNIAERVSFMVTGRFEQLAPSHRSDSTS
ncbi:MAG TPA: phosphate signaling complex protein PhoU [Fimbriimonadaceae bacterium]|nr:phosphate signaling complex protein PhoU [Fimbriimonadaceae bacterium]